MYTYEDHGGYHVVIKDGTIYCEAGSESTAKEIIQAVEAWKWLKDARSSDLKQWGLLPATYCIHCKREHDDGDCYA